MGRSQEIERCATRVIALSNAPWHSVPDMEAARYEANRALAAALALPPEAAAPVANPVDACPMCKSAWPSVLYDPCERMTAPNSWHYSVPPPREGG